MIPWQQAQDTVFTELANNPRFGTISDVDGTLSHLVDVPDQALVTPGSRQALVRLQSLLPLVAVVSGRGAADVYDRVGVPGLIAIGNHGFERWTPVGAMADPAAEPYLPALQTAVAQIEPLLEPGMTIEDKGPTLSVHYRRAADPKAAAARLQPAVEATATELGLRFYHGRMVFELRPPLTLNKGTAFTALVDEFDLEAALYIGDDTTDVDALLAARQLREQGDCYSFGVGVVDTGTPPSVAETADFVVDGVAGVESLLDWLANAVSASRT